MRIVLMMVVVLWNNAFVNAGPLAKKATLIKAAAHGAPANGVALERGTLILYFDKEPLVEVAQLSADGQKDEIIFQFPEVKGSLGPDIVRMINQLHTLSNLGPLVKIKATVLPAGLTIAISHDKRTTGISYDIVDTITLHKSVVIRIHDLSTIEKLRETTKPILVTAWDPRKQPVKVTIDCGHGGDDYGAISSQGVMEKNVCLQIGNKVATLLHERGVDVLLTRLTDTECSLAQRVAAAHDHGTNALVSIHANHAPNEHANGLETFYFSLSGKEPRFSTLMASEQKTLQCWFEHRNKITQELASCVHDSLIQHLSVVRPEVIDRKVKKAASQLLVGSQIPAILVEVGFLSHTEEGRLLGQESYQMTIALGIAQGIVKYCFQ